MSGPLELHEIIKDKQYINIKNGKTYVVTGFGFHSETHDYLVYYLDDNATYWARPIGLFMLKFKRK